MSQAGRGGKARVADQSEVAKRRIEQAASVEGKTVSGFIVSSALESADEIVRKHDAMGRSAAMMPCASTTPSPIRRRRTKSSGRP